MQCATTGIGEWEAVQKMATHLPPKLAVYIGGEGNSLESEINCGGRKGWRVMPRPPIFTPYRHHPSVVGGDGGDRLPPKVHCVQSCLFLPCLALRKSTLGRVLAIFQAILLIVPWCQRHFRIRHCAQW